MSCHRRFYESVCARIWVTRALGEGHFVVHNRTRTSQARRSHDDGGVTNNTTQIVCQYCFELGYRARLEGLFFAECRHWLRIILATHFFFFSSSSPLWCQSECNFLRTQHSFARNFNLLADRSATQYTNRFFILSHFTKSIMRHSVVIRRVRSFCHSDIFCPSKIESLIFERAILTAKC